MIARLLLLLAAAGAPASLDKPAYIVPADWSLIEGIASDGKRVWVSSVVDRAILELDTAGHVKARRLPASMGAPFGIAWDARRRWLWIAAMCPVEPAIANCGRSGLYAIDAKGKIQRSLTLDGVNPGDLSIDAAGGRIFLSDSLNGAIFTCAGDCTKLQSVIRPTERASAQGSVITADGKSLVVADYSRGIMLVDLATGTDKMVKTPDGKRLRGMDGLVRVGTAYVGIQNPGNPAALVAFEIGEGAVLAKVREIELPAPLAEATQLVIAGDRLLIVADAQWRLYTGKDAGGAKAQKSTPIASILLSALTD